MVKQEGVNIGRTLVLVGGVLMVVFGIIQLITSSVSWPFAMQMPRFYRIETAFVSGVGYLAELIVGIIAIAGSKKAEQLVWTIVLLIGGLFVGGWGGILVSIGALVALISHNL